MAEHLARRKLIASEYSIVNCMQGTCGKPARAQPQAAGWAAFLIAADKVPAANDTILMCVEGQKYLPT